jgi:hypothetical protein
MKRHLQKPPAAPIVFPRANPEELAKFDVRTKTCDMGCGPHNDDPRSKKERLFLCTDCCVHPPHVTVVHVHPPIPDRSFDYRANYTDDPQGPFGWGATESEAKAALAEISN